MSSRSAGVTWGTPESSPCWSSVVSFVTERSIGGREAMAFLLAEVRQAEGFYDAAPTEAKNVAFEAILLMPARVVYNGSRAEGPAAKPC